MTPTSYHIQFAPLQSSSSLSTASPSPVLSLHQNWMAGLCFLTGFTLDTPHTSWGTSTHSSLGLMSGSDWLTLAILASDWSPEMRHHLGDEPAAPLGLEVTFLLGFAHNYSLDLGLAHLALNKL